MPKAEMERRLPEAAGRLGLADLLDRKTRRLFGGQRQRVATGRTILREPALFLLEKPLFHPDAKVRLSMRHAFKEPRARLQTALWGLTIRSTLGDRHLVMDRGWIEREGPPLEVDVRPKPLFVPGFLGSPSMDLLQAKVAEPAAAVRVDDRTPGAPIA